jgi:beta-glucosidase
MKNKESIIILTMLTFGCAEKQDLQKEDNKAIEVKVDSLLSLMTLDEKIGQMSQVRHFDDIIDSDIKDKFIGSVIHTQGQNPGKTAKKWQNRFEVLQKKALETRLGIPLLFGVDAVHGQNTFEGATIFPHNIGMGATGNADLVKSAAEITAIEAQATGFNWVFSPCVAIPYSEKWGRVYEAYSESTELTTKLTRSSVLGHQGILSKPTTVMATAKHFIGDGATDFGIEGGNTTLSLKEIKQRLLPPYQAAVDAGVGSVMVSFNKLSGQAMHAHKELITGTLKNTMGFDGIVLTDWKGYSRFGKNEIINAGVDMVMAVDGDLDKFHKGLKQGIDSSLVSIERIDDAVKRILRQKFRLGLFENPFSQKELIKKIGIKAHRKIAKQAVRESLVLLKNTNQTLPISKETEKIVVVGEHADNTGLQSGGWTVNWQGTLQNYKGATSILKGIQNQSQGNVVYDKDANGKHFDADVAIIVVGETPYAEFIGDIGNGKGTYKLNLSKQHQQYIKTYKNKVKKIVVVLVSGRPLVTTVQINESDAFVASWLPGSEGDGIAEVLFGDFDFKGKLPHSWPKYIKDFKGKYGPNFWDNNTQSLFPFGYGLSYKN